MFSLPKGLGVTGQLVQLLERVDRNVVVVISTMRKWWRNGTIYLDAWWSMLILGEKGGVLLADSGSEYRPLIRSG